MKKRIIKRLSLMFLAGLVALCSLWLGLGGWGLATSPMARSYSYEHAVYWTEAGGVPFSDPFAIAVDQRNGHVFVTDARNQRVVVFDVDGTFLRQFGSQGEGPGQFERPTGIAIGPDGLIYVADFDQDRIQKFTEEGDYILAWGGPGSGDSQFQAPNGMVVDSEGRVYVADFQNKAIKVFDENGRPIKSLGKPGQWGVGKLDYPTDVTATPDGGIIVADAYNHRIQRFDLNGNHHASWGWHLLWLVPRPASGREGFHVPTGVAFDPVHQFIHVADSANRRVVMLDIDGAFVADWALPEPSERYSPTTLAVSPNGNRVYATDTAKNRVVVLEVRGHATNEQQ